jgi:hypothetical protein
MDPTLVTIARAGPSERLNRWLASTDAERYDWFLNLLDRAIVYHWTIQQTRAAVQRGDTLTIADVEGIRETAFASEN